MAQPHSFHFPDHWAMLGSRTNIRIPALRYFWRVALGTDTCPLDWSAQPQRAPTPGHIGMSCTPLAPWLLSHLFGAIRVWAQLGLRAPRVCRRTDILKIWIPYAAKPRPTEAATKRRL